MKCEYCDCLIEQKPENGTCPNCGGVLRSWKGNMVGELAFRFPEPPIGVYKDVGGYVEIEKDCLTFYRHRWPFTKKSSRTIPFSEIYSVSYIPPTAAICGAVCVREWQDRHIPLPTKDFSTDGTSVYFTRAKQDKFFAIYCFLKQCADIVHAAEKFQYQGEKIQLVGKYQGFYGYMEVGAEEITFYKKVLCYAPTKRIIPYSEIAEVAYRNAKGARDGGLSVRTRKDGKDIQAALMEAITDETSIEFSKESNEQMRRVYDFLMNHARENVRIWSE